MTNFPKNTKRNFAWASFVGDRRRALGISRRELARRAEIDASYITLIESNGYVPLKDKIVALGRVLGNEDEALLICDRIPHSKRHVARLAFSDAILLDKVPLDSIDFVQCLSRATADVRAEIIAMSADLLAEKVAS